MLISNANNNGSSRKRETWKEFNQDNWKTQVLASIYIHTYVHTFSSMINLSRTNCAYLLWRCTLLSFYCSCCRSLRGLSCAQAVINFFIQFLFRPNGQYKNCWQMTMTRWSHTDSAERRSRKKRAVKENEDYQMRNGKWRRMANGKRQMALVSFVPF